MTIAQDGPTALVPIGHVDALGPCHYMQVQGSDRLPPPVAAVWRSEVRLSGTLHVVPDCCVELVLGADGSVEVWGPSVAPRQVPLIRDASYEGVRLRVGAAATVLGVPVDAIAHGVVSGSDAGLPAFLSRGGPDWVSRLLRLAAARTGDWLRDPVASVAPAMLDGTPAAITEVAARLGLGERQLRRRFAARVGASPSAYRRLARTRRAVRDLGRAASPASAPSIAEIAYRHGFADQSHLTREVVAVTGTTPGLLRRLHTGDNLSAAHDFEGGWPSSTRGPVPTSVRR